MDSLTMTTTPALSQTLLSSALRLGVETPAKAGEGCVWCVCGVCAVFVRCVCGVCVVCVRLYVTPKHTEVNHTLTQITNLVNQAHK